jgi:hypothetical protein
MSCVPSKLEQESEWYELEIEYLRVFFREFKVIVLSIMKEMKQVQNDWMNDC